MKFVIYFYIYIFKVFVKKCRIYLRKAGHDAVGWSNSILVVQKGVAQALFVLSPEPRVRLPDRLDAIRDWRADFQCR